MKDPCTNCKHCVTERIPPRIFTHCDSAELKKGFHYDGFWYWHTCDNQDIFDKCRSCTNWDGQYCNNVFTECRYICKEAEAALTQPPKAD